MFISWFKRQQYAGTSGVVLSIARGNQDSKSAGGEIPHPFTITEGDDTCFHCPCLLKQKFEKLHQPGVSPLYPNTARSGLPLWLPRPCRDAARPRKTAKKTARTMEPPSRGGSPDCRPGTTGSSNGGTPNGSSARYCASCRPGRRARTHRQRLWDRSGLNCPIRSDTSPDNIPIRYRTCHTAPTDSADSCRLWQCRVIGHGHRRLNHSTRHCTCIARPRPHL